MDVAGTAVGAGALAPPLLVARMSAPTPEEEFEAAIWQAMKLYGVTCDEPTAFVISVRASARLYAASDSEELTAYRRAILHRERDDWGGDTTVQTPRGTRGGVSRTAPEPPRPPGSAAFPQAVADGGATRSTRAPIPGPVTSNDAELSTAVDGGYPHVRQ